LTNHGVDQADKLGDHLCKIGTVLTHIYASPLTRTSKTAEAIRKAQTVANPDASPPTPNIVKVPELIEQDFGYYEGKSFQSRSADSKKTGRETHREKHKDDPGFVDVESKESMAKRADCFLDEHLLPLFNSDATSNEHVVAVISHGILLSNLWRRLLLRLPRRSLTIAPKVTAARGGLVLEHLGGWSNTGYLHLEIRRDDSETDHDVTAKKNEVPEAADITSTPVSPSKDASVPSDTLEGKASDVKPEVASSTCNSKNLTGYSTNILAVDSKQHLAGLKRQRGGIGRSAHDESQKKLDGFFKKQRVAWVSARCSVKNTSGHTHMSHA
jgi:broad specificity phosphatase PhoE